MRMTAVRSLLALLLTVGSTTYAETSLAGCGDVTGDKGISASDALLVLKRAVGQTVALTCTYNDVLLDYTQETVSGDVVLDSGFSPDPYSHSISAGGPVNVRYLGGACAGFAGSQPDFRVNYVADDFTLLRFYWIPNDGADGTMIINGPNNTYFCNDDSFNTLNPTVDFINPSGGAYDIWIGSIDGHIHSGTLYVSETASQHP
jgi:hypothetical protein